MTFKWRNTLWALYIKVHRLTPVMPKGRAWWAVLRPHSWCEIKPLICEGFHFSFSLPSVGRFDHHPKSWNLHAEFSPLLKEYSQHNSDPVRDRIYVHGWEHKTVLTRKNVADLQGMKFTRQQVDVCGFHLVSPLTKKLAWKAEKSVLDVLWAKISPPPGGPSSHTLLLF